FSWQTYLSFISIVSTYQKLLVSKDKSVTLVDAHSFLWTVGTLDYIAEEDEEQSYPEGPTKFALHRSKERNRKLVKDAKRARLRKDPLLHCEVCGISFLERYGEIGRGFIEAHHKLPVSELNENS